MRSFLIKLLGGYTKLEFDAINKNPQAGFDKGRAWRDKFRSEPRSTAQLVANPINLNSESMYRVTEATAPIKKKNKKKSK